MFHIANKVYLEYDFKFNHDSDYILASDRWNIHPITISKSELVAQVKSFNDLIAENYGGDIENFWAALLAEDRKLVIFVDPKTMKKLQFQYWKSIFGSGFTAAAAHTLHASWIESVRLLSYYEFIGGWDSKIEKAVKETVFQELTIPTVAESNALFSAATPSTSLIGLDKNKVSFEYLLADYLANNNTSYKTSLVDRVKFLTWDNWLDELEHLKYEILSGTVDVGRMDPTLNVTVGNIETELAKSNILKWTVDPDFGRDIDYIRRTYDYNIFVPCWAALMEIWNGQEDMTEVNTLINTDQYETLLQRDIARGYGCSYTRTRFMNKCNQVFSTFCYDKVRKNQAGDLAVFSLRK